MNLIVFYCEGYGRVFVGLRLGLVIRRSRWRLGGVGRRSRRRVWRFSLTFVCF